MELHVCTFCGKKIDIEPVPCEKASEKFIEISLKEHLFYSHPSQLSLHYHKECFFEIAGEEYRQLFKRIEEIFKLNDEEKQLLDEGQKIDAIKSYRRRTRRGLKESKDLCDMYQFGKAKRGA